MKDDDQPTLFVLPASVAAEQRQRRPQPLAHRPMRLVEMVKKATEKWKSFFEWSGFEKREIEVEMVPGHKARVAVPQGAPPRIVVFKLQKNKLTGEFKAQPLDLWGGLVRVNATLCEDLGLPIGRTTLWRLIYGGFLTAYRTAPMTTLLELESLRQHLIATRIDGNAPPFWTQDKITRYREWEKMTPEALDKMGFYEDDKV